MNLENIYDNEISPLMTKIIAVCKENDIAMLSSFQLDYDEGRESYLKCTTALLPDHADDKLTQARNVIYQGNEASFMAMTITSNTQETRI